MMPPTGGGLGMARVPSLAVLEALARYSAALAAWESNGPNAVAVTDEWHAACAALHDAIRAEWEAA